MKASEIKKLSKIARTDTLSVFMFIADQAMKGKNELHMGLSKWEQPKLIRLGYGCKKCTGNWYQITW